MGKGGKPRTKGLRRKNWIFIGGWVPKSMAAAVTQAIQSSKLDRSKFLRQALEDKLRKEAK